MQGSCIVIITGNLGKDVELRYTPSGNPVAQFSVATTEKWTTNGEKHEKTEWHSIVAWGKLGELCNQYLKKGKSVYLEGRLATRSWDDNNGVKRYKTEIVASKVLFLSPQDRQGSHQDTMPNYDHQNDEDMPW